MFEDELLPEIGATGKVVVFGESPTAKVVIWQPDYEARRFRLVDRLSSCKVTESRGMFTFEGVSDHLRQNVRTSRKDSVMRVLVSPGEECEDCNK